MRLFWAAELPEPIVAALLDVQAQLRGSLSGWRFSRPEQLHLTLKFVGEAEAAAPLADAVRAALAELPPGRPRLQLGRVGSFGGQSPRVVWVDLQGAGPDDMTQLMALAHTIDTALAAWGVPRESRDYRPHVTLGRPQRRGGRRSGRSELKAALEAVEIPVTSACELTEVCLFESRLDPGQPAVYRVVERLELPHP